MMKEPENELNEAIVLAARIVARYGEQYLPIFERLEDEMNAARDDSQRLIRAIEIARTMSD